jgi:hypothetical protein
VGVLAVITQRSPCFVAGQEPDADPGRDAERARHQRHRAGEVDAVARFA